MLKNYFKIAWRNLWNNKTFTLLNLGGLTVSLAACIIIFFWISDELHYDTSGANADRVYRGPYYVLTISKENVRKVRVDAAIPLREDTLWMSPVGISPLPDGYGTFIQDLQATGEQGNDIHLTPLGKGMWKVDAPVGTTIHLRYRVAMEQDGVPWSVSAAFARAYALDNVLFFTGRTVFIASKGLDTAAIQIHFVLPSDWKLATAYPNASNDSETYQVNNLSEMWDNGNLAGDFRKEEIAVGKLRVILAGTFSMEYGFPLLRNMIEQVVNSYTRDMGGTPAGRLVILGSVAPLVQGGETFQKSISLVFNQPPDMSNKEQWAALLSHEILHLWNGQAIVAADQSLVEWFVEGFTDYLSLLTACRTGFITETEFLQRMSMHQDSYTHLAGRISMVEAGADKGLNYGLIYSGGASVAMALDIVCRRATKNRYGLFKILEKMYSGFGITHKGYTYEDIVTVSSAVTGANLSRFFLDFVAGVQVLPLKQYLGYAGLRLQEKDGQTIIEPDPDASQAEKELFTAVLYK